MRGGDKRGKKESKSAKGGGGVISQFQELPFWGRGTKPS